MKWEMGSINSWFLYDRAFGQRTTIAMLTCNRAIGDWVVTVYPWHHCENLGHCDEVEAFMLATNTVKYLYARIARGRV